MRGGTARHLPNRLHALLLSLLTILALAAPAHAAVLPPDAVVDGKTVPEWAAEWWKWVHSIPLPQHPFFDPDGSRAAIGQPEGRVFFVAGPSGPPGCSSCVFRREFSVPEGKYLLVPLLPFYADNVDTVPPLTIEELRNLLAGLLANVESLHAELDGAAVPDLFSHRVLSPAFSVFLDFPDSLEAFLAGHPVLGLIDPAVADGYWLMFEPLPPGRHVLRFGSSVGLPFPFTVDITDTITVVPTPLTERVADLIASVQSANLSRKHVRPLLAALRGAEKSFAKDHLKAGIRHLRAFQKKVRHELGKRDPALAEQFIAAAQRIIDQAEGRTDPPIRALPPHATLFGTPHGDYAADWYRYNFTLSTNQDAVHLPAGSLGSPVYFMADGFFGDPNQEHIFTIPENAFLFLPVISINVDNVDTFPPLSVEELRALGAAVIDQATNLVATVNGAALPDLFSYRALSPVFSGFFETADNLYTRNYGHPIVGLVEPIVADGYYLVLEPLPIGTHVFSVGADFGPPVDFSYRFGFRVEVVPVPPVQWLQEFIPVVRQALAEAPELPAMLKDLEQARKALERGHWQAGIHHLRAFQNSVTLELASNNPSLAQDFSRYVDWIVRRTEREL